MINIQEIFNFKVKAQDGEIGKVVDVLFDDQSLTVRYFVVKTGSLLFGRKVLLSPLALDSSQEWTKKELNFELTIDDIKQSPDISTDQPVSRQKESELMAYYNWPSYWNTVDESTMVNAIPGRVLLAENRGTNDSHLRSIKEIRGYRIQAQDGEIGHLESMILDFELMYLRYLIIDTKNWLPGKLVLVASDWLEEISWAESRIRVDIKKQSVIDSPEYNEGQSITREIENSFYEMFAKPKYWE